MSFEKKSLINNMTATKKAIIASSPASPSVGSKVASKVNFSKVNVCKTPVVASKINSKMTLAKSASFSKSFSKSVSKTAF